MSEKNNCQGLPEAIQQYQLSGQLLSREPYGSGHINDTFLLAYRQADGEKRYILQRMNQYVFQNPPALMENVVSVTRYLRDIIEKMEATRSGRL